MKGIIITILVAIASVASAQRFAVQGQLADSSGAVLPHATVLLLHPGDSSLVNFAVGNEEGEFVIPNVAPGYYLLRVTFLGYKPLERRVSSPASGTVLDLGRLLMRPAATALNAVEITAERAPVTIRKDTIEFNAGSFRTKENAVVEDLLRKLPGIDVDTDGNITAQGEQVKSVTVDGKTFFGNDPKLATRNLPADAIDKVQVFDKASDQATFSGIDDGQRQKTINLQLKEEKRNALFGTLVAGLGPDERFEGRASLNKFGKGNQTSFLAMGNNINESGFGIDEYMNFTGSSRQMMGGGGIRINLNQENTDGVPVNFGNRANGVLSTYAGGVNLNREIHSTEVNSSYFYNYLDHNRDQQTIRESYTDKGSVHFQEDSREHNTSSSHRINATVDHRIDSVNTLRFRSNVSLSDTDGAQSSRGKTMAPDSAGVSRSEREHLTAATSAAVNSSLLFRHKFGKPGRSLSANLEFNIDQREVAGDLSALNSFEGQDEDQLLRQRNEHVSDYLAYGLTVSYTEPLGGRRYMETSYSFRGNRSDVTRDVYDIGGDEATLNEQLSSRYRSEYEYHRAGLNFRVAEIDYNLVAGWSLQQSSLKGNVAGYGEVAGARFRNLLPSLRFSYDFSSTRHLRFDYETSVREPAITQLQPIVDNSDPLNLYVGNPGLRPAYSHGWRANFTTFNPVNMVSLLVFADVDYTVNAIIHSQNIDDRFVRTVMPVNVPDNLSVRVHVNTGIPVAKIGSRFSVGGSIRSERSTAMLNGEESDIATTTAGGTLRYNYRYKEMLDLTLRAGMDHQRSSYGFDQPDQAFLNSTLALESNVRFLKNYSLDAGFEFLVYRNRTQDFLQRIPLLNVSVSRFVFSNKRGEIRLSAENVLDKALNIDQTARVNYIERVTTNSLGRYFMVSFIYALNKALNPMGMRRGGEMIRMRR